MLNVGIESGTSSNTVQCVYLWTTKANEQKQSLRVTLFQTFSILLIILKHVDPYMNSYTFFYLALSYSLPVLNRGKESTA